MDIGFIGIGSMGAAMVPNLVKAGHHVSVWNRTLAATRALEGVTVLTSIASAFERDAVVTMLSDDTACICVRSFSPITSTPGGKCPEMCEQVWPSNMSTGTNFPGQTAPHLASSIHILYIGRL